jgi:hypothetical protein
MNNSFQIFERSNKIFHFTKGNILFLLMIITLLINSMLDQKVVILKYLAILSILVYVIYYLTECFRYQFLNGKFLGNVLFYENEIVINERKIEITEIKKIFLRTDDYVGRQRVYTTTTIPMSNGTNNLVDLDLINGEKIKLFFKIDYENQVEELQPFIITLIKNEILTREEGVKILHINTDYRYDKFITEVNKKELD